ncbi:MAG: 3-dehydroquinate synthase [Peptococcaceae bacterium]|nr:3-dehydroquinate synthase [Peptococcaceae bacterium]
MIEIPVKTKEEYRVLIGNGLLARAGELTRQRTGPGRVMIVADDRVDALYGAAAQASYEAAGFAAGRLSFPRGEGSKNLAVLGELLEKLAVAGLTRQDILVALGGGVTGDLTGFAAAVYLRGIRYVQLPTTLLAAVDSSVGGKTAVDLNAGKNLCGAFKQPELVVCDCGLLQSLPAETFAEGLAESIKYGVIADADLFEEFKDSGYTERLEAIIGRCVAIKAGIVAEDEFDYGRRQLLNFGHTIGHGVEKLSGYGLSHGYAVAVGMAVMSRAAEALGWCREPVARQLAEVLERRGLPQETEYESEALAWAALADKKRRGDSITLIVPEALGRCVLKEIPVGDLASVIRAGRLK